MGDAAGAVAPSGCCGLQVLLGYVPEDGTKGRAWGAFVL